MMRLHNKTRGFTLIELMVVISIIGFLASIILAALHSASLKANDARVMSEMISLRNSAELFRAANGGRYTISPGYSARFYYSNTAGNCLATFLENFPAQSKPDLYGSRKLIDDINHLSDPNDGSVSSTAAYIAISDNSYAVIMTLPSSKQNDPKDYVCIDSTGPLKKGSASATTWRTHVFTTIPYHCI